MLLWHVVLIPVILVALVGGHVLLVRVRGVSHPLPATRPGWRDSAARKAAKAADAAPWRGATRRYDILKEATIATAVATGLVLILAGVLSSPDVPPVSVQSWAKIAPADFVATAAAELSGTALAASYGPPYNHGTAAVQQVGPVNWQKLAGVTQPIDAAVCCGRRSTSFKVLYSVGWVYHEVVTYCEYHRCINGVVIKSGKALLAQWTDVKYAIAFVGFRPEVHACMIS